MHVLGIAGVLRHANRNRDRAPARQFKVIHGLLHTCAQRFHAQKRLFQRCVWQHNSELVAGNAIRSVGSVVRQQRRQRLQHTIAHFVAKAVVDFQKIIHVQHGKRNAFFPLDSLGFGNQGEDNNFHFTTELHTQFKYNGGETFRFTGDDDLWVFINDRLAIDIGGIHGAANEEVNLDASAADLGISIGQIYSLDLFHAERHTSESNFRVDTNLEFVDCGEILPEVQ